MRLECLVCFEALETAKDVFAAPCGHMLHHTCWMGWFQTANNCPKCRQTTQSHQLIKMYFNMGEGDDTETLMNKMDELRCDLNCKIEDSKRTEVLLKTTRDENLDLKQKMDVYIRANAEIKKSYVEINNKCTETVRNYAETAKKYEKTVKKLEDQAKELGITKTELEKAKGLIMAERNKQSRPKVDTEMIRKYQGVVEGLKHCTPEFDYMKKCKQLVQKLKIYTDDIDASANLRLDVKKDPSKYVDMFKEVKKFWICMEKREENLNNQLKKSPRGCVILLTGFPPGRRDVFPDLIENRIKYHGGKVAWVTYNSGDAEAYVRLKPGPEKNPAEKVLEKLSEKKLLRIKDFVVNASVLQGDEETKFLRRSLEARDQNTKRFNNNEYECDDGNNEVGKLEYMMSLVALT